ncbi:uncharacterized protein LOC111119843 isoform X2 [Crassostrea virginica]
MSDDPGPSSAPKFSLTKSAENYCRLCQLIMTVCSDLFRDILSCHIKPADLRRELDNNKTTLIRVLRFPDHRKLLFPQSGGQSLSAKDMDLIILYTLLRNICGIPKHQNGWGNTPKIGDMSLAASIDRIREQRNFIASYSNIGEIDDSRFHDTWKKLRDDVVNISSLLIGGDMYERAVNVLLSCDLAPAQARESAKEFMRLYDKMNEVQNPRIQYFAEKKALVKAAMKHQSSIERKLIGAIASKKARFEKEESSSTSDNEEDIDSLGIDYLLQNLPSDHRTFPMIAETLSTDEEKEKGCLSLNPGMLDRYDEQTQKTSVGVNVNVVPDQSNVTSPREENHVVDNASNSPSSTEGTLNANNSASAVYVTPGTAISYAKLVQNFDLDDCLPSVNMDNLKMLSLLDFAGHSAYYACHHIFLSPRAFFILVVDMTKDLGTVATEACTKEGLIYSNWTYADYIKYWLGSIHTYSSKVAPVILAFTHSEDNGADPEKALQYFCKICECLPRKLLDHLDKRRIYSFQKQSDKNVEAFKECLADTVKSLSHWGERVPISWTKLEAVLRKLKESNYVVSFSNLLRLVLDLKINKEEDLLNALIFFNDTGVILFRSEIKDIIILDVQWLVDAFKRIIFDEKHMEAMEDMSDFEEFQELKEHGLLSSKVLNVLWQNSDFYQHKHSLVNHMKQLDMLAELSKELWYVPCMNKQKYSWEILNNCNVSSRFCFLFEFLPFIIYHRLVVACINDTNMGMKPWKRSERMCIFHTVTILTYKDDSHRVLIAICDNKERPHRKFPYSIEIQINVTKTREIDTCLTSKLKKEISDKLTVLTRGISSSEFYPHVGYRCRLETFGKNVESHIIKEMEMSGSEYDCPKCKHAHIVDVGSIRRFWEKDESHIPWTDILSDVGLMNVAKQLGAEWTLVVGHLGLKQAEIDQIKLDNPYNTINQITIALQRWRDRQEGQADTILQQLFSALRSCDRTDLLEEIQERNNITENNAEPNASNAND